MTTLLKTFCLSLLAPFALAGEARHQGTLQAYEGEAADAEIRSFMAERWGKQVWHIESRSSGEDANDAAWYVKGTMWRVRLEPAWHFSRSPDIEFPDLEDLDRNHSYQFVGNPVDQAYGVVAFYVTSVPVRTAGKQPIRTAEQDGAGQAAARPGSDSEGGDQAQPESGGGSR